MKITLIDRKRIGIGNYAFGSAFGDKDRMLVYYSNGVLSTDNGGDTWRVTPNDGRLHAMLYGKLNDGTYVGFDFSNVVSHKFDPEVQEKIPFVLGVYRAKSYDDIVAGKPQRHFTTVDIPDLAVGYGDSGDHTNWGAGAVASGIVQTENGDVIVSMYGQFKQDKSKLDYFTNYDFYQYRTWLLVSHDNCETFEYLSTVADCMTYPVPEAEGYCESDLLYLGNGRMLCVMRTQGHEVYTPMMRSLSSDYGKTWSAPEPINPYGVLPRLIKLQNGTVVVCSGKWDIFLQTSEDDGETWSKPFVISENDGQWDRGPSGYNSIFETDDGTLVVIYDITEDKTSDDIPEGERRIVYVSRYKVEK